MVSLGQGIGHMERAYRRITSYAKLRSLVFIAVRSHRSPFSHNNRRIPLQCDDAVNFSLFTRLWKHLVMFLLPSNYQLGIKPVTLAPGDGALSNRAIWTARVREHSYLATLQISMVICHFFPLKHEFTSHLYEYAYAGHFIKQS